MMNRFTAFAAVIALSQGIAAPVFSADPAQAQPTAPADAAAPASVPAAQAAPSDPSIQLNYGSILFYKGLRLLRAGDTENGKAVFKEVETRLREAMRLAAQDSDPVRRQLAQCQAAFLLGEVSLFVWRDSAAAKAFYEQAVAVYPEHDGAREKLKGIDLQQKLKP